LRDIFVLSPALRDILLISMARYSLFVLKVLLNTKQTNKLSNTVVWRDCSDKVYWWWCYFLLTMLIFMN